MEQKNSGVVFEVVGRLMVDGPFRESVLADPAGKLAQLYGDRLSELELTGLTKPLIALKEKGEISYEMLRNEVLSATAPYPCSIVEMKCNWTGPGGSVSSADKEE